MGSKQVRVNQNEKLISVKTADLKSRLNKMYTGLRASGRADLSRFDYLWDLKELALMEGRQTVDIPETWLDEIEKGINQQSGMRGH